jgi:hypothetical protein
VNSWKIPVVMPRDVLSLLHKQPSIRIHAWLFSNQSFRYALDTDLISSPQLFSLGIGTVDSLEWAHIGSSPRLELEEIAQCLAKHSILKRLFIPPDQYLKNYFEIKMETALPLETLGIQSHSYYHAQHLKRWLQLTNMNDMRCLVMTGSRGIKLFKGKVPDLRRLHLRSWEFSSVSPESSDLMELSSSIHGLEELYIKNDWMTMKHWCLKKLIRQHGRTLRKLKLEWVYTRPDMRMTFGWDASDIKRLVPDMECLSELEIGLQLDEVRYKRSMEYIWVSEHIQHS